MFQPVTSPVSFPKLEENVIRFWREREIYEKSLALRRGAPAFVFYEGPPTANGLPHPGHCLTRAIKDLFPRYKTMRGYLCERKGGWDTHGLPVEVEVCKELGIHSKEEIEAYGMEPFIRKCVESVFRYTRQWEQLTERLGFWIHLDEAYVTFHQSYVESVWWALKNLFDRGLLYQGHKIVWWWAQGGTALSAGEVGQGYREVADPSVYVRFPIIVDEHAKQLGFDENTNLLVWTTTPWTLVSNQFAAVHPELKYERIVDPTNRKATLIVEAGLAREVIRKIHPKGGAEQFLVKTAHKGSELIGLRYKPPFGNYFQNYEAWGESRLTYDPSKLQQLQDTGTTDLRKVATQYEEQHFKEFEENGTCSGLLAWRVVSADFVTTESGTGVVHLAPAFGEDDAKILVREQDREVRPFYYRPKLLNAVAPDGKFTDDAPEYCRGRWVKDCDRDIIRDLRDRGLLFHMEQYLHDYPFCWRAEEDPLIQYPRRSWFIRTTQFKEQMLANNRGIHWLPGHIRDGRFGNFLETNVDWALSRERYWGTPLPIWVCEQTGYTEAIATYAELLAKPGLQGTEVWEQARRETPTLPEDLKVHKPYIDAITYDSPQAAGARMRRVPEVIDCWFDSGAMPFAQWGYPHQRGSEEPFRRQFPADFISEALDQTRGWFYSLVAISTLLFGEGSGFRVQGSGIGSQVDSAGADDGPAPLPLASQSPIPNPQSLAYPHPFRNCIVLGLMLGEDGGKMSKQKRNYREPEDIFNRYGADALRWYFFANQPPWTSIRYSEQAIKDCIPEFLLRLWNVYSFFVIYANIDGFDPATEMESPEGNSQKEPKGGPKGDSPIFSAKKSGHSPVRKSGQSPSEQLTSDVLASAKGFRPLGDRAELDRWVLSELSRTAAAVVERMDAYDNFSTCQRLSEFVDALSNWYVRRSRDRFWSGQQTADKSDAYWTLYECLLSTAKLVAPFVPFLAEALWQNLAVAAFAGKPATERPVESVHLCDYPQGDPRAVDETLSARMAQVREIVSLGRSARMGAKLKVRQPLAQVEVVLADKTHLAWLEAHTALIRDELNVKHVEFIRKADQYINYTVLPDLKRLGPRLGKRLPAVRKLLAVSDAAALLAELESHGRLVLPLPDGEVTLEAEDVQIRLQAKKGWAAAQGRNCVVVLSTELTPELIQEGVARELVRVIQDRRKEIQCDFTDRIEVGVVSEGDVLRTALKQFGDYIRSETLAVALGDRLIPHAEPAEAKIGNEKAMVYLKVVSTK